MSEMEAKFNSIQFNNHDKKRKKRTREHATLADKLQHLQARNAQKLLEKVSYKGHMNAFGAAGAIPFGILLRTYKFLAQMIRAPKSGSQK
jgi:hypothetical protein